MAGILTPLQLTAAAGLLNNNGLKPFPPTLAAALAAFNATTVISNFIAAVNFYKSQSFANQTTLQSLLSIGSTVCPALGNSIPASPLGSYPYLQAEYLTTPFNATDGSSLDPSGFSNLIEQTCAAYLGNGDIGRFAQGFMAVQGYISLTNQFINSAVNAQTYLGPTFIDMDSLVTNQINQVNPDFGNFSVDLTNQGNLTNFQDLRNYGTPAALLRQLASQGNMIGGVFAPVQNRLLEAGLTNSQIQILLTDSDAVSENEFLRLQQLAYAGMTAVTGADLDQVLDILEVTTPNIKSMSDLLDQTKIFPNSYSTLLTPSPQGPVPIYGTDGSVNMNLADNVANYLASPTGCEDLTKVIPAAQAVANKSVQVAFEQITNITNTVLPELAAAVNVLPRNPWDQDKTYLADTLVANAPAINGLAQLGPETVFYRAQQDVPAGIDITDTTYWLPTTVAGLNTMAGLSAIQSQTSAISQNTADYFADNVATGTGPNGTITTYDVLGLAIDSNGFATQINTATTAINTLQSAGSLSTLNTAYTNILLAANDAAVLTEISNANSAIAALSANPNVSILNIAWLYMADLMNLSAKYTTEASLDYFNLIAGDKVTVMAFVQNLPQYGIITSPENAAEFLINLADTTSEAGQAIIGTLREGQNNLLLNSAGLNLNIAPSASLSVTPVPAVIPVY